MGEGEIGELGAALEGIRVLDISRAQMGPCAGAMLAELGADVIKVEPLTGDFARGAVLTRYPPGTIDAHQLALNHGKRSLAVDYSTPRGKDIVLKLAKVCDVFMHNFRPGTVEKIGLGYDVIREINPRIVYCHITGFGRKGPLANYPAMDLIGQGMSGIMSVTGDPDGPPMPVGVAIADQVGGITGAFGIVVALLVREKTGIGQEVDVNMLGSQLTLQAREITHYLVTGKLIPKAGRGHGLIPGLWQIFRCSEGKYIALSGVQQKRWLGLCRVLQKEEWLTDPRFDTAEHREQNRGELLALLDPIFAEKTSREWIQILLEANQVVGPVLDYGEMVAHPQIAAEEMLTEVVHGKAAKLLQTIATPVKLSRTPGKLTRSYPELGEHTEEVLQELGYTWDDIISLKEGNIIP